MIRPPTQIPGGAGGTNTSDDVGGIALVVLTETLRQKGSVVMKNTAKGFDWQPARKDAQDGTEDHRSREGADANGFLSTGGDVWLGRCIWKES